MNYFEFFNISVSFNPDLSILKQAYFAKSKEYHPDFFTNATLEEQNHALQQSSFNNTAYKVLSNEHSRFKYILELGGLIGQDIKEEMPQEFLLEMMDFNEELMDLQFDFQEEKFNKLSSELETIQNSLTQTIEPILKKYPNLSSDDKQQLKNYYFQSKYLNRLDSNLKKLTPTD